MSRPNSPDTDRSEIDALKASVDLAQLVSESGVALRKVGKNLLGNCPFHSDDEASLSVNTATNLWNCFACQIGGDALSWLQTKESLSFPQALEKLRELAAGRPSMLRDVPAVLPSAESPAVLPHGISRHDALSRLMDIYTDGLRNSRDAQGYLTGRGLGSSELWRTFRLGYANGAIFERLPEQGDIREAYNALGVLTPTGRELMAGCIVVPLYHPDDGLVALYGRKIARDARIKHLYLRGPQRGVLNWQTLQSSSSVLLAESVLDALSLWTAGCADVTALYGVSHLPPDLDELLARYAVREVRFCLDADEAGRAATYKLSQQLSKRAIRCLSIRLPEGEDPNSVLSAQGAEALLAMASQPRPIELTPDEQPLPPEREETGDGFTLRFGEVAYRITPRPPFTGRLRITYKATRGDISHTDSFDLLAHRARAIAINETHRKLQLAKAFVEHHFVALMDECERWVEALRALQAGGADGSDVKLAPAPMTDAEREDALAFLRRGDLVDAILEDMEAFGYTGEEQSKLLAYLIGVSRKLKGPLSGIIISQSGAGKSTLAELVEKLTPPEEVVLYTRMTAQSLAYMPKDSLKRKLVIIEEREGVVEAQYHIRVLQSQHRLRQVTTETDPTTGRRQARVYEVEGPIAYLETTTHLDPNVENTSRCFELHLDESEAQTRRVHQRQRQARLEEFALEHDTEAIKRRHHNAQRLLEPAEIFVPYAGRLTFPARWLRTRRDHERFLSLIESVTFLHQFQRETGVKERNGKRVRFVRATTADYRLAWQLAKDVLWSTFHELGHDGRELLEAIRQMTGGDTKGYFSRRDVRNFTDWQDYRLREALQQLVDMEYLGIVAGSQGRTYQYRLLSASDDRPVSLAELTTPEQLEAMLEPSTASGPGAADGR